MSHFSLLVVTEKEPTQDLLAARLQPFHEFECTGVDDQYVENVDRTGEARAAFQAETCRMLRAPDGSLCRPHEDRFYRDPTPEEAPKVGLGSGFRNGIAWSSKDWGDGRGYRAKVQFVPEGWSEVKVPARDITSFADWARDWFGVEILIAEPDLAGKHKYGWIRLDPTGEVAEIIDRTNPNKKWDWWVVGGRWNGHLPTKDGRSVSTARRDELETVPVHFALLSPEGWAERGEMGWFGCVSNERDDWDEMFARYAERIPGDWYVTTVDCHI